MLSRLIRINSNHSMLRARMLFSTSNSYTKPAERERRQRRIIVPER